MNRPSHLSNGLFIGTVKEVVGNELELFTAHGERGSDVTATYGHIQTVHHHDVGHFHNTTVRHVTEIVLPCMLYELCETVVKRVIFFGMHGTSAGKPTNGVPQFVELV